MKYHYNSLIISLALANSTLFPTHLDFKLTSSPPVSVIARSTCQSGINRVLSQIQAKGVGAKHVGVTFNKGGANKFNYGNPTKRTDSLDITLSAYNKKTDKYDDKLLVKISKIIDSPNLLKKWSEIIADNCSNVATVDFANYGEDGFITYAIQKDGTMKRRTCNNNWEPNDKKPWNVRYCS